MQEILFLLLPLAFYSGWSAARKRNKQSLNQTNNAPSDQFVTGINFLLNEEPDKALDIFLETPVIDVQTADTFLSMGNMFRNRGEVNRALRVHQHLVARPDLGRQQRHAAMLALGEDFFAAGLLDRAESVFREVLEKYPESSEASEPLRHIYEQLQEWDKAIELSEHSVSDNKKRFIAHYYCEKAETFLSQNQLYQTDENLKAALAVYPDSSRVRVLQAELALARTNTDLALEYFLQAIRQDGRLLGALSGRLLEVFTEKEHLDKIYEFVYDLYQQNRNALFFPALLSIAKAGGYQESSPELVSEHLRNDSLTLLTVTRSVEVLRENGQPDNAILEKLEGGLQRLLTINARFQCLQCGYKMHSYLWRCPACHQWDSVQNN